MTQAEFDYYATRSGQPATATIGEHKRAFWEASAGAQPLLRLGELERIFYQTALASSNPSLNDLRALYYGSQSGLTPGNAVSDHMAAFFANPPAGGGSATVAATSSAFTLSGAAVTVNTPAGAAAGDLLVAVLGSQSTKAASPDFTSAGWTRSDDLFNTQALTGDRVHGTYVLPLTAAPAASYTFTRTAGGSGRDIGVILLIKGPESASPFDAVSGDYDGGLGSVGNARSVTAFDTVGGLEVFYFYGNYSAGSTHVGATPPAGFTARAEVVTSADVAGSGRSYLWVGTRNVQAPSAPTSEFLAPSTPVSPVASHLILKGAARTDTTFTIADMEAAYAAGPVRMSHRGGSLVNSEFTKVAFDNSVARGYRILEFSSRLTSDGERVGMHDATLDRVTALTGNVNAQTWGTLGSTPVDVFAADGGLILSLQGFLSYYGGGENVLIIEDKTYADIPTMLTYIEGILGVAEAKARVVFKGNIAASWAPIVKARGYKIWSYNTGAEIDTLAASPYLSSIDYVSLDYTATQAQWNTAASLNKPLWAHVITGPADAALAAQKAQIAGKRLAGLQVGSINTVFA